MLLWLRYLQILPHVQPFAQLHHCDTATFNIVKHFDQLQNLWVNQGPLNSYFRQKVLPHARSVYLSRINSLLCIAVTRDLVNGAGHSVSEGWAWHPRIL